MERLPWRRLQGIQVEAASIFTGLRHNSSRIDQSYMVNWGGISYMYKQGVKLLNWYCVIKLFTFFFLAQYLFDLLEPFHPLTHFFYLRTNNFQIKIPQIKITSYMESNWPCTVNYGAACLITLILHVGYLHSKAFSIHIIVKTKIRNSSISENIIQYAIIMF
jgi:hypothetical protein